MAGNETLKKEITKKGMSLSSDIPHAEGWEISNVEKKKKNE